MNFNGKGGRDFHFFAGIMNRKVNPSPFVAHVFFTAAASVATVAASLFVLRFIAEGLGIEKFGAYSLSTRLMGFLLPFSLLGLNVTLPRFVSMAPGEREKRDYLLSAVLLGMVPNLLILAGGFLWSGLLAKAVFHDAGYQTLFLIILFWEISYFIYSVLDSYYFGTGQIRKSNYWQIFLGVAGPLFIAFYFSRSGNVNLLAGSMAALYLATAIPLGFNLFLALMQKTAWPKIQSYIKELWIYTAPRFPVRFVLGSLLSLGPLLAPHFGTLQDAGFLIIGQMVFSVTEMGSVAFSRVILPKAGELVAQGRHDYLKERIEDIVVFVFHAGIFMCFQLIIWTDQIILVWLGGQFKGAIPLMRILITAMPPYLLFIMLSPIIDTVEPKPVNLKNLIISFVAALAISLPAGKFLSKTGLAFGTTSGIVVLGFLTVFYLWKHYRLDLKSMGIRKALLWNTVFFIAGFAVEKQLTSHWQGGLLIATGILAEGIVLALYLAVLYRQGPRWIHELSKRVFHTTGK